MSDEWDFYPLRVDGEPASIYVDLGIRKEAPISTHPTMASLRVRMRKPREDGLSSQDEFEDLIALEDHVTAKIAADRTSMFVGRNTSGGNRDFYFYTNDPEAFRSTAGEAMGRFSAYQYEIGTREDRNWRTYFNFLHPSERSMQLILNRRVRRLLEQNGDSLRNERQIDHLARLPSPEAQSAFASYVKNEGFAIASIPAEPDEEGQYLVDFSKFGLPTQIDDLVLSLFDKAAELGGVYDGWGCEATP